ncbi:MAG: hypothetical protein ACI857_001241 [Arenicella sp.]|jgi:hypothetical protein
MKYFLLIFTIGLLVSCRKDDVKPELPEPRGNVLLLELDASYSFEGGLELQSNNLVANADTLPINSYRYDPNLVDNGSGYVIENTTDTILKFENGFRVSPSLFEPAQNFSLNPAFSSVPFDSNVFHKVHSLDNQIDLQLIWDSIKTIELIYSYGNLNPSVKMSVVRTVVYEFDSQLDVSIPRIKFFVVIGY